MLGALHDQARDIVDALDKIKDLGNGRSFANYKSPQTDSQPTQSQNMLPGVNMPMPYGTFPTSEDILNYQKPLGWLQSGQPVYSMEDVPTYPGGAVRPTGGTPAMTAPAPVSGTGFVETGMPEIGGTILPTPQLNQAFLMDPSLAGQLDRAQQMALMDRLNAEKQAIQAEAQPVSAGAHLPHYDSVQLFMDLLAAYEQLIMDPLHGFLTAPWHMGFNEFVQTAALPGKWGQFGQSFREWDKPRGLGMGMDIALDPAMAFPFIGETRLVTKPAQIIAGQARKVPGAIDEALVPAFRSIAAQPQRGSMAFGSMDEAEMAIHNMQKAFDKPGKLSKEIRDTFGIKNKSELAATLGEAKAEKFIHEAMDDYGEGAIERISKVIYDAEAELQARSTGYHAGMKNLFPELSTKELEAYRQRLQTYSDEIFEGPTIPEIPDELISGPYPFPKVPEPTTAPFPKVPKAPEPTQYPFPKKPEPYQEPSYPFPKLPAAYEPPKTPFPKVPENVQLRPWPQEPTVVTATVRFEDLWKKIYRAAPQATDDPVEAVSQISHLIPGRDPAESFIRLWAGAREGAGGKLKMYWDRGNRSLQQLGIGRRRGQIVECTEDEMDPLFAALHDGDPVPANMRHIYNDLKSMQAYETAEELVADPGLWDTFMSHPFYFYRGWRHKVYGDLTPKKLGAIPDHLKPRNDATYKEMRAMGYEPISWNPYDMMAIRRMNGVEYREGKILAEQLTNYGKAVDDVTKAKEGWRVPEVGPAFEGKLYVDAEGKIQRTSPVLVPKDVANVLESVYGTGVRWDALNKMRSFSNLTKRAKLLGSWFQHMDFGMRSGGVAFSPTAIAKGGPVKFPFLMGRFIKSTFSQGARENVMRRAFSHKAFTDWKGKAIVGSDGEKITPNLVAHSGWQISGDPTMWRRGMAAGLRDITERPFFQRGPQGAAVEPLRRLATFFENGLFDGVYKESQLFALENLVVPALKRAHPEWTSKQLAMVASDEVNKMFSTLPVWQSMFKNPTTRQAINTILFSSSESESLLRQALSAAPVTVGMKGAIPTVAKNWTLKGFGNVWLEYFTGLAVFMVGMANALHLAFNGEFLPEDRYQPLQRDPEGKLMYNSNFLKPTVKIGDTEVKVDLMGQMDTAIRWAFTPIDAINSRFSVPIQTAKGIATGETFMGEPIPGGEIAGMKFGPQTAVDLLAPISGQYGLQAAKSQFPEQFEWLPEAEGRLSPAQNIIQATGINLSALSNSELRDKFAQDKFNRNYNDLQPFEKKQIQNDPAFQEEMNRRVETGVRRGQEWAEKSEAITDVKESKMADEAKEFRILEQEIAEINASPMLDQGDRRAQLRDAAETFQTGLADLQIHYAGRNQEIFKDIEEGDRPDDPNRQALYDYLQLFEPEPVGYRVTAARIDWEALREQEARLRKNWTPEQTQYVEDNTGISDRAPELDQYYRYKDTLNNYKDPQTGLTYWETESKHRKAFRARNPVIEQILTSKYWAYTPLSEQEDMNINVKAVETMIGDFTSDKPLQSVFDRFGGPQPSPAPTPTPTVGAWDEGMSDADVYRMLGIPAPVP